VVLFSHSLVYNNIDELFFSCATTLAKQVLLLVPPPLLLVGYKENNC